MFQVFLIIFWATIRLQSRGEAVCDPSVGAADSSPQGEGSSGCVRDRITPHPSQATPSPQGEDNRVQTRFCTNIAQSFGMRNNMVYAIVPNRDTAIDVFVGAVMRL